MSRPASFAPVVGCLIFVTLCAGCYDSFGRGGDSDSGVDTSPDVPDTTVLPDAFEDTLDAGVDADAEPDAGEDTSVPEDTNPPEDTAPDAPPPLPREPNPASCRIEPTIFPFDDPVLEYRWPTGPVTRADSVHVSMTPLVIDLEPSRDEDLEPVLVFTSYPSLGRDNPPGVLRIVDPRTNTTISNPDTEDAMGVLEATGNLAAGDIDGDGRNEIVGLGVVAGTYAYRSDGTLLWQGNYPRFIDRGSLSGTSISGGPVLADLEGDGTVEVIVGRSVMRGSDGTLIWTGDDDAGRATNQFFGPLSCVADLDGDGFQEVISGQTAFRFDGEVYWETDAPDGLCAVADILEDVPGPEVVLVSNGYVRLLNGQTGEQAWVKQLEGRVRLSLGGAPTVADFDGDGEPEIGVAHGAAYGVYDPACERRGDGCTDTGLLWKSDTSDASSSGTGSSVFDFNGDGAAEVVYNDEYHFRVYDGTTGDTLFQHRNSSRTRTENPTIADIDNDGDAEIIFSANAEAFFIRDFWTDPGVEIWGDRRGRWVGARRIWNQHAYSISNVEEDGSIPRRPEPSWEGHNSYRQNLVEGDEMEVLNVPDLWGGRGDYSCVTAGVAEFVINVQNFGLERAGIVTVAFYRGDPDRDGVRMGEVSTVAPLAPGDSQRVTYVAELSDPVEDWYAVIDDPEDPEMTSTVFECREGNNKVLIWRPECR